VSQRRDQREEIERALGNYQATAVAAIAGAHGVEKARFPRKNDQVAELARRLAGGDGLREHLAKLSEAQREALAFVARKGGSTALTSVARLLRRQLGDKDRADKQLRELLTRGLLLFGEAGGGYWGSWRLDLSGHDPTLNMRVVWMPRSVAALLPPERAWAELVERAPAPAAVQAGEPGDLLRDVYLLLRSLRARPVRLTQQGAPHATDMRRLVAEMRPHVDKKAWEEAAGALMFVVLLAHAAGLVVADATGMRPSAGADEFVAASRPAQVARLYAAWLAVDWNELERVPALVVDGYAGGYGDIPDAARLGAARRLLGEALTGLSDGDWWSVAGLGAAIRRRDPDFLTGGVTAVALVAGAWGAWSPYAAQSAEHYRGIRRAGVADYRQSLLVREADWDAVEGAYIRQVIAEPLRWLGLVDAGLDAAGQVAAVRVTPLGRSVLTGAPGAVTPAPAAGPRLVVQPNFEVIVLDASASLDLMARLDRFATARSVDRAAIYHLSREGLVTALQAGQTLAEIERLLEEESGGALPQNVAYSLAEWARQFERVTVRPGATLLEADEAAQLDRWLSDPALARLLGPRLSATVVLVPAQHVAAVEAKLGGRPGWRSESALAAPAGALRPHDDGLLLRAGDAGRFETHRLAGFAELVRTERAGQLYRLTPASVERARAAGWTADKLLALLRSRLGAEPPADMALKVRGWLGEFAPAQQATVRLLRLPDPALWRLVEPAAAGGGLVARVGPALAIVDETALALVGEALAGHGVRLEATTPLTAAAPLLTPGRAAAPAPQHDLQTLRGKALRDWLNKAAQEKRGIVILHQGATQKTPRRLSVTPRWVEHRISGYYLLATTQAGADRAFKLDDIFGVALEEAT
jgi:hypothetical protein